GGPNLASMTDGFRRAFPDGGSSICWFDLPV
ncbi:MAG: hypothetical protein ACI9G1_005917, partial [Pirellulaceae bacterium]